MKAPEWLIKRTRLLNVFHLLRIFEAHSQMTEAEKSSLAKYAEGKMNALEIGTYMGVSANLIAKNIHQQGVLYCVDPFISRKNSQNPGLKMAERDLRINKTRNKVKFLIGFSTDPVIQSGISNRIDFAFIDGDHSYEGLKNDWNIVKQKVMSGGIVCLRDTILPPEETWRNFGSVQFYNDVIIMDKDFELIDQCHFMTILRRR